MAKEKLSTDEKLDLILKYTKSARRWRMVSAFISFIFLLVFIILPLIGIFIGYQYLKENVDVAEIQQKIEEVKSRAGEIGELSDMLKQLPH